MSFEDGFKAIKDMKTAGVKLNAVIDRISTLENKLTELQKTQDALGVIVSRAEKTLKDLGHTSATLAQHTTLITAETEALPRRIEALLTDIEAKFSLQQRAILVAYNELPRMVEKAVEIKIGEVLQQSEERVAQTTSLKLQDMERRINIHLETNSRAVTHELLSTVDAKSLGVEASLDAMRRELAIATAESKREIMSIADAHLQVIIEEMPRTLFGRRGPRKP